VNAGKGFPSLAIVILCVGTFKGACFKNYVTASLRPRAAFDSR